jgi:UrcA family protein
MTSNTLRFRLTLGAIALTGSVFAGALGSTAQAQPAPATAAPPPPTVTESVTVVAPRVTRREATASGPLGGAPVEVYSLSHNVSYADLDLTTREGVVEFQKRIMYGAIDACDALEAQYPSARFIPVPASQNCPDTAARAALTVADEIIAAARAHAR